jgi:hypothetical protein
VWGSLKKAAFYIHQSPTLTPSKQMVFSGNGIKMDLNKYQYKKNDDPVTY